MSAYIRAYGSLKDSPIAESSPQHRQLIIAESVGLSALQNTAQHVGEFHFPCCDCYLYYLRE